MIIFLFNIIFILKIYTFKNYLIEGHMKECIDLFYLIYQNIIEES